MNQTLNYYVKYDEEHNVVPMSLVKMIGFPRMKGNWRQVRTVCCDPDFVKFQNNSTPLKAYMILNKKGEPMSGPIIRKNPPSGVFTSQIEYNICCDDNVLIIAPGITTQPANQTVTVGSPATFNVVATGTDITYQWFQTVGGIDTALTNNASYAGVTTPTLTVTTASGTLESGEYFVKITNVKGTISSTHATLTTTP